MSESLSVVIPAYNEEANIARSITYVYDCLKSLKIKDFEVIVVNDGSKDKTGEIAKSFLSKYSNLIIIENKPNRGYGGALKTGFYRATKRLVVMSHADNQFDLMELPKLIRLQKQSDADIVCGIRSDRKDPILRKLNGWLWNTLVRGLFGYLAEDIDCGFKLFKQTVFAKVNIPSNGAMIDTQLLASARARGLKIVETPVTHLPRTAGNPTGADLKVIAKALRELMMFWWHLKQEILVEQGKAVFRWEVSLFIAILLLAAFLRLYKIDQYMTFLGDEGRDALIVRDMVLGKKFTLIGPGTSIGNMYLGPLYYYLMIPALALFGLSPVGPAVMIALFGGATVGLLWWWSRQLLSRHMALLISGLYAISPTVITLSHSSWNPNIMPFFALLTMYGIWKVWRFGYWRWLIIASISFAFVLNSHYLGLLLAPIMVLFSRKAPKKYILFSILSVVLLMSPLFIFDARHGWNNFAAMKQFFTDRQTTVNFKFYKAIPNLWPIWQQIVTCLISAKNIKAGLPISIFLLTGLILIKNKSKDFWFITVWMLVGLVGLGLYKQHIYDHYFGFLFPAIFLMLGYALENARQWILPIIIYLVALNLSVNPFKFAPNNQLKNTRVVSEFINQQSQGQPFNIALLAKQNYDRSYRYFLNDKYLPMRDEFTGKLQMTDQLFVVCEISPPAGGCKPIGDPLWEIAAFGWARIDRQWEFPWGVKLFKLVRNTDGKPL